MTREEAQSCIKTIELLRRLAYNIHGVMDVIDAKNCEKIIEALSREPSEDVSCSEIPNSSDSISRQAAIDTIMGQPPEPHYPAWYAAQIEELPAVQPDRDVIDDCLRNIYKNISVHTATGGVIAIRYYMEKLYEEIYGEGEKPWWMT